MTDKSYRWIGPFRVDSHLGSGATGEVFLAEDPSLGRKVAIKILKHDYKYDHEFRNRFLREARSMASLTNQNVVAVHAIGDEEGVPYMVMEYMKGNDLLLYLEEKGPLSIPYALDIFMDVISGLKSASELKIIHRDIKPANIFLSEDNHAKIGDFGLARAEIDAAMTADGVIIGTPDYLAPEVIEGKKSTLKSDIYSLGCSFYHAVTGTPPFRTPGDDSTSGQVLARQLSDPPPPLNVAGTPRSLRKIILQMMDKNPDKRPGYDKVVEFFKKSRKSETLTISIPRLSTIAATIVSSPDDMDDFTDESDGIHPLLLISMGFAISAGIIAAGIIFLS
ncbi:MAG: serine/threonine protein kinase [Deltaproteobacteria bacterium]|nr:serine/threonine protein kinase [Deltaproteobacteria bacterium]